MTKQEAIECLTARWRDQNERYPMMVNEIPLDLYLRRNVPYFLKWRNSKLYARLNEK